MSTTPHAAAAGAARQRLAGALGTLQQDPNVPPPILEIVSGLARAMGPLFQLERGNPDLSLFVQARSVLQETLAKMQSADQSYPGVADATSAIAQALGTIFQAMREAGLVPPAPAPPAQPAGPSPSQHALPAQPAAAPVSSQLVLPAQPAAVPAQPDLASSPPAAPVAPAAPQSAVAFASTLQHPNPGQPLANAAPAAPVGTPVQPAAAPQPAAPFAAAGQKEAAPLPLSKPGGQPAGARPPSGLFRAQGASGSVSGTVPIGPNGLPRIEAEIGVHSETNFYTDFLGDIRNHGGIFIATFHVLPIGSPCEVVLTFPGNLSAELRGTVKWKRESSGLSAGASPGLGIEITHAPAETWNLIDRFMRKREPIMHEL